MEETKVEEATMKPEDLKLLIEENEYIKHCLKVMNDIPLLDDEERDYVELWNNVSLTKKIDPGQTNGQALGFYFALLSTGYDIFGAKFFQHMSNKENAPYLYYAIKCFLDYMSDYTEEKEEK